MVPRRLPTNQSKAWEPKFQLNMNTSAKNISPVQRRTYAMTVTRGRGKQANATMTPGRWMSSKTVVCYIHRRRRRGM